MRTEDKPRWTYNYLPWLDDFRYVLIDPEAFDGETIIRGEN